MPCNKAAAAEEALYGEEVEILHKHRDIGTLAVELMLSGLHGEIGLRPRIRLVKAEKGRRRIKCRALSAGEGNALLKRGSFDER